MNAESKFVIDKHPGLIIIYYKHINNIFKVQTAANIDHIHPIVSQFLCIKGEDYVSAEQEKRQPP